MFIKCLFFKLPAHPIRAQTEEHVQPTEMISAADVELASLDELAGQKVFYVPGRIAVLGNCLTTPEFFL